MNILDLLFPRRCVNCGKPGKYFCHKCLSIIQIIKLQVCPVCEKPAIGGLTHPGCQTRYSLDGLTSFFVYNGPIKKAIKQLKYQFVTDLAEELVSLGGLTFKEVKLPKGAVLTSVPLHPSRRRWRGFNQSELLGRLIAENLGLAFAPDLLMRVKNTRPQVELDKRYRHQNIKGAFRINRNHNSKLLILNSEFFLFDDVWTTGATLRTGGAVLKKAGAKKVLGLTLAR